jgi:hypothetical protein
MLEPDDGKLSCPVLRRERESNLSDLSEVACFSLNIFTDIVFAGKHSIPDTKHYCNNGSVLIYVMIFELYVNQF